jgi:hypothetical protein
MGSLVETIVKNRSFTRSNGRILKWPNMNVTAWRSAKRVPRVPTVETADKRIAIENGATPRRARILTEAVDPRHRPRRLASSIECTAW